MEERKLDAAYACASIVVAQGGVRDPGAVREEVEVEEAEVGKEE